MQSALSLDSLRNSHPIEVPVRNALEVDQIFDAISYLKGSSVIRMLSAYLRVETFLAGVAKYLDKHKFGNATTDDLWAALTEVSGQDVKKFMDPWIRKIGFPVVTVDEKDDQITVVQRRFLRAGDIKPEENETEWWIPLGLKHDMKYGNEAPVALTTRMDTIRDVDEETEFYKLNADQTGFYRTNYPIRRLEKLAKAKERLSVPDRIGLVGDTCALAQSGDASTTSFLSLVANFRNEGEYMQVQVDALRAFANEMQRLAVNHPRSWRHSVHLFRGRSRTCGWPQGVSSLGRHSGRGVCRLGICRE